MESESSAGQRHSYDMRGLDEAHELRRLREQVSSVQALEELHLSPHRPGPDGTIVDLGCGPGYMSNVLSGWVPQGRVVGVDIDPGLLGRASRALRRGGVERGGFVRSWAHALPLADGVADLVYARFLFQHLDDPAAVLREIRRIGRPGGALVILDTDDGSLLVHPEPPGLRRLLDASYESQRRVGGDRHIGRRLRALLLEAGLAEVEVDVVPFTSEQVGVKTFIEVTLGFKGQIVQPDLMSQAEVAEVLSSLRTLDPARGAFAHALGYLGIARFPETSEPR